MVTLIHGDDNENSRKKLNELLNQSKDSEIVRLNGGKITLTDIIVACESTPLIGEKRTLVIENLLSGKISSLKEEILNYLKNSSLTLSLLIWEKKTVTKTVIKKYFPETKEYLFQIPQLLFKFLDQLGSTDSANQIRSFHNLLPNQEASFIYAMMLRQIRNLIIAKDLGTKGFPQTSGWQAQKLISQARKYSLNDLISLYRQLLSIDYKIKSGITPLKLEQLIDIYLAST